MTDENDADVLSLTAELITAYLGHNTIKPGEVPDLIKSVHASLTGLLNPAVPDAAPPEPAVSIRASVKHDYIVCLEDGAKLKMLKRYLRTRFDMTPEDYRAKWNLPRDYPMVAPAYAEQRRGLAQKIGLGRKKITEPETVEADIVEPAPKKARAPKADPGTASEPKRRGRPPKAKVDATPETADA